MPDEIIRRPQVQRYHSKSKVIGEFVDAIPEVPKKFDYEKSRTSWERQPGIEAAFSKAFRNPGKALILVDYNEGAMSVRKKNAKLRVMSFNRQGYTEENGWIIRAVETKVYAMYQGAR
jgi:hypothetical protein